MLFADKLDDFHNPDYQRFHLIKLLQLPPAGPGRYVVAGRYVALAAALDIPINHLTSMLNRRNGRPYRYWRIGTSDGTRPRNRWDLMRDGSCVAIGWPHLSDLSAITHDQTSKDSIRAALEATYPNTPQVLGRTTQQIFRFVAAISAGDVVIAADGTTILGVGKVTGGYRFEPDSDFPHRRSVQWIDLDEWQLPVKEGLQTAVHELKKEPRNLVSIEQHLVGEHPVNREPVAPTLPQPITLTGVAGRIEAVLERKGQVILYGPPGTGKTYWAETAAHELAARQQYGQRFEDLSVEQRRAIVGDSEQGGGLVRMCTFHPAYGYEDFLEGYRPVIAAGGVAFTSRPGIFKQLCRDAQAQSTSQFYLIIDEINRGDIARIFGELLTVMEKNKRGRPILLPLSGQPFAVPPNVSIIGTMNTADRSIALLDTALRRRFGFIELMPDSRVLGDAMVASIPLGPWLDALNQRIQQHSGRDARNLQIGHSYLLDNGQPINDLRHFTHILADEIIPLVQEYCYEDYAAMEQILGSALI